MQAVTAALDRHLSGQHTAAFSFDAGFVDAGKPTKAAAAADKVAVGVTCGLAVLLVLPCADPLWLAWPVVDACLEEDSTPAATAAEG
jgi:hypothetical protein